jgi:chlorosome envelope protein H
MAAEELNKPVAPTAPAKQADTQGANVGNGDMAHLIGNMGILIDSTIESVQGVINSVSSATGQLIEGVTTTINSDQVKEMISTVSSATGQLVDGVTSTMNSDQVKEMISTVSSATGQLVDGVTATLNSEQVKSSFQELGKLWTTILENLNTTVATGQVQDLFNNVSAGLSQLMGSVMPGGMPGVIQMGGSSDKTKKEIKQIPFSQKEPAAAPAAPAEQQN